MLGRLAGLGAVGLAGCLGAGDGPSVSPTDRAPPSRSPTAATTTDGTASPTAVPSPTATPVPTPSPTPAASVSVEVGPDRSLRFDPKSFAVGAGEPVRWVFRSLGHNVRATSVPDGASWTGTPGEDFDTFPVGFVHRHTFTVPGRYDYMCVPHRSSGMVGTFTVEA